MVALVLLALDRLGSAGAGGVLVAALLNSACGGRARRGLAGRSNGQPRWVTQVRLPASRRRWLASLRAWDGCRWWISVVVLLLGGCCGPALTGGLTSQLSALVREGSTPSLRRRFARLQHLRHS